MRVAKIFKLFSVGKKKLNLILNQNSKLSKVVNLFLVPKRDSASEPSLMISKSSFFLIMMLFIKKI
jgi:hypothetical protein